MLSFYDTIHADNRDQCWAAAMLAIMDASNLKAVEVGAFLESGCGRAFADDVNEHGLDVAVALWFEFTDTTSPEGI